MKKGIEEIIKNSLDNYELPYNASAWEAMQAKLDAKTPVSAPKSNLKYYVAASAAAVVAVASYLIFADHSVEVKTKDAKTAQTEITTNTKEQTNTVVENETINTPKLDNSVAPVAVENNNSIGNTANNNPVHVNPLVTEPTVQGTNRNNGSTVNNNGNPVTTPNTVSNIPATSAHVSLPTIAEMCEGATFEVDNTNNQALVVDGPALHFIVPANAKRTIRTKAAGIHTIGTLNANSSQKEFNVKAAPTSDFVIDEDTKFENGLPTTKVEAIVPGDKFTWIFNNHKVDGQKADAHFYTKGNHNVSLIVTGANGCTQTTTKTIYINEKYNLMAENAFVPSDLDPRNQTFMPYALKERNVAFTLIIVDPTDGRTVFQTNDASNGWDGTDMRTGQPVQFETSYIWKVTIENPLPNELNEYGGNILPMHSK